MCKRHNSCVCEETRKLHAVKVFGFEDHTVVVDGPSEFYHPNGEEAEAEFWVGEQNPRTRVRIACGDAAIIVEAAHENGRWGLAYHAEKAKRQPRHIELFTEWGTDDPNGPTLCFVFHGDEGAPVITWLDGEQPEEDTECDAVST